MTTEIGYPYIGFQNVFEIKNDKILLRNFVIIRVDT